ncbi:DUF2971 domain-containing protein [Pseudophaeobacter sp. TrK17]|uniref:DUF2971 domain-containing protein n=1 Tax=Pseudophaeobacter sp. TrK17 TaxID=2815167 RepID=UPI0035CF972D
MPRLYYFTGSKFALENLRERHIKISFADKVNDIFELTPFDFGDDATGRTLRREWKRQIKAHAKQQGFVCFSHDWRCPAMWGHYSENHYGVCYGFDVEPQKSEALLKIRYVNKLKPFNRTALRNQLALNAELEFAKSTKSTVWGYEREWRVYCSLTQDEIASKENGEKDFFLPFGDELQLKEVIIGAKSRVSSSDIKSTLNTNDDVVVRTARASFREYKIVEQNLEQMKK